eukprot:TRINITY_DN40709_c0_g1_i1.p1 TRINITY_DN40709_c0_g1~~TRINITY_DN40709_c0_g1_i1.p1  ORF type:complete len:486 (-),score=127.02 TRINITY_DN40709_c0_g1_i1:302-1759(-)
MQLLRKASKSLPSLHVKKGEDSPAKDDRDASGSKGPSKGLPGLPRAPTGEGLLLLGGRGTKPKPADLPEAMRGGSKRAGSKVQFNDGKTSWEIMENMEREHIREQLPQNQLRVPSKLSAAGQQDADFTSLTDTSKMPLPELQKLASSRGLVWTEVRAKNEEELRVAIKEAEEIRIARVQTKLAQGTSSRRGSKAGRMPGRQISEGSDEPPSRMGSRLSRASSQFERAPGDDTMPHPPFQAPKKGTVQAVEAELFVKKYKSCLAADEERRQEEAERLQLVKQRLQTPGMYAALDLLVDEMKLSKMGLDEIYAKFDINGDGDISKAELARGLRDMMGVSLKPVELDALMRAFDLDNSQTIDFEEFSMLLRMHQCTLPKEKLDGDKESMGGFRVGDRVRLLVATVDGLEGDQYKNGNPTDASVGTVLGAAPMKKLRNVLTLSPMVNIKLDLSGRVIAVKARQLEFIEHAKEVKKAKRDEKMAIPWAHM